MITYKDIKITANKEEYIKLIEESGMNNTEEKVNYFRNRVENNKILGTCFPSKKIVFINDIYRNRFTKEAVFTLNHELLHVFFPDYEEHEVRAMDKCFYKCVISSQEANEIIEELRNEE